MPRKRTPAQVVIDMLGVRPLARALNINPSTVMRWKTSGNVPSRLHLSILKEAKANKLVLTANDLVHGRKNKLTKGVDISAHT